LFKVDLKLRYEQQLTQEMVSPKWTATGMLIYSSKEAKTGTGCYQKDLFG